tara:strand:+ start:123 stop:464 length:342 start_codon:yes stop_codon:yes gene_type:complete
MASRYGTDEIIDNSSNFYSFLRKMRQNQKNIRQYETPVLRHPTVIERALISSDRHIWTVGDRFYKIAGQYYNDSRYWWVIAWYNEYPTEGHVQPGTLIDIPISLEEALLALGQ